MALDLPIGTPLTETQSELSAKISSMKSLLSLPTIDKRNIPKEQQVSTFDFLKKILEILGLSIQPLLTMFVEKVFDLTGTFLEDNVLSGVATSLAQKGVALPNIQTSQLDLTPELVNTYTGQNLQYLKSVIPASFLAVVKQQIVKDLTLMMFGPKDSSASEYLNPDPVQREYLINEAICSSFAFSMSNDPIVREEDIEYNRIALAKQLEQGEVVFNISCQNVKISLPENPAFIFEGGGQFTIPSEPVTPAQSVNFLIEYVGTQVQNINTERNRNSAGKSFFEVFIEMMIGRMSSLVQPHIGDVYQAIQSTPAGQNYSSNDITSSTCDVLNSPNDSQAKAFGSSLVNALYKALISIMLVATIREFKKLVANYFAKISFEKARRKAEKIKQKFSVVGDVAEQVEKAAKYKSALSSLSDILTNTNFT